MQLPAGSELSPAQGTAPPALDAAQTSEDPQWRSAACAAAAFLCLAALLTLFLFRARDDNRLTSWNWVFSGADLFWIAPALAFALLLAVVPARFRFGGRRPAAALFCCSYAAAALFWDVPEVIVDASRYFTQAKHVELYGVGYFLREWGGQIAVWTDLPLVPLLYGLIFSLAGEQRVYIQFFTTLLFSASVVLTYLIGRALWDEVVGICAGALLLGMPYLLTQVPLMLVDVPTMFFLLLAVYATLAALTRGGGARLGLASVAVALAFWSKYSAWLFLSVLLPLMLIRLAQGGRPAILRGAVLAVIAALLIGAGLAPWSDVVGAQLGLLQSYQLPGLARWQESPVSTFLFQSHPFIAVAALISFYPALRQRDASYVIILWLPALVLSLGINRIRYLLPVLPMVALMAAYALRQVGSAHLRNYILWSVVASSLIVSVLGFRPFLQQTSATNLRQAGAYLDSLDVSAVEVIALQQRYAEANPAVSLPLLDLYTTKPVIFRMDACGTGARGSDRSSLRFTWEQGIPGYYATGAGASRAQAVVLIADDEAQPLPDCAAQKLAGYRLSRRFIASENVFGYKTIVKIYASEHHP